MEEEEEEEEEEVLNMTLPTGLGERRMVVQCDMVNSVVPTLFGSSNYRWWSVRASEREKILLCFLLVNLHGSGARLNNRASHVGRCCSCCCCRSW